MDQSVDPCVDFYRYACGGWQARTTPPPGYERFSRVDEVRERTLERLRALLDEKARENAEPLGRFYRACTDVARVDEAGLAGIEPLRATLREVRSPDDLSAALGRLHRYGIWAGFEVVPVSEPGPDGTRTRRLVIEDAPLGLPSRDHYLASGASRDRVRREYRQHIERVLRLGGASSSQARRAAKDVLRIETELARVAETQAHARRIAGWYQALERAELDEVAPTVDWGVYAKAAGWPDDARIGVIAGPYLARFAQLVRSYGSSTMARYLEWRMLDELTPALTEAFATRRAAFAAYLADGTSMVDTAPVLAPRWRRCVALTDQALGAQLSRAYEAAYAPVSESRAAEELVRAITRALAKRIGQLEWLDGDSQERARAKLASMSLLVGRSGDEQATVGSALDEEPTGDMLSQVLAGRARRVSRALYSDPVTVGDPARVYHVDGYYDPRDNSLRLTPGLLQPPFFAPGRPRAVALGALAGLAGHQAIHAIDDVGASFDPTGNAGKLPWSHASQDAYAERARCLVDAYHGTALAAKPPHWRADTAREDIAELGGLGVTFRASAAAPAEPPYRAGGLSEAQLFFVASAQSLCEIDRRESFTPSGQRSPAHVRVNRGLAQLPAFAEAFQCAPGVPMRVPAADICQLWQ